MKWRARKAQRHRKLRLFSGEIDVEPFFCFCQYGGFSFLMLCVEAEGEVFLPLEPQAGQSGFFRCQKNFAYGGLITARELHIKFSRAGALLTAPFPQRISALPPLACGLGASGISLKFYGSGRRFCQTRKIKVLNFSRPFAARFRRRIFPLFRGRGGAHGPRYFRYLRRVLWYR